MSNNSSSYHLENSVGYFYGAEKVRPAHSIKRLQQRLDDLHDWLQTRRSTGTWPYSRSLDGPPTANASVRDELGNPISGINYGSQDYLGLASHPDIKAAAIQAINDFGPHSAGSPMLLGNTRLSLELEKQLGRHLGMSHVVLFPTGWAAGFGTIMGLMRAKFDYVLFDGLAHQCLRDGSYQAMMQTPQSVRLLSDPKADEEQKRQQRLFYYSHLDSHRDLAAGIDVLRSYQRRASILVVTESLFSMDADWPEIAKLRSICRDNNRNAKLMVDVAHDLGAMGPQGTGVLGLQNLLDKKKVDLIMGSFSKTFASNGGFVATNQPEVRDYVKLFGSPHIFSNAISPVQAAVVLKALEIVRSDEGDGLRADLMKAVGHLRDALAVLDQQLKAAGRNLGIRVIGEPSPIVPVEIVETSGKKPIARQDIARLVSKYLFDQGVIVNLVEHPAVAEGTARFRFQVMPSHTEQHAQTVADLVRLGIDDALGELKKLGIQGP